MKICILYGNPVADDGAFTAFVEQLAISYPDTVTVDLWKLDVMNLNYCIGCWNCWWKTPGECIHHDDAVPIFRSVIAADLVIFASPLLAGFTSSSLKKITDRLIVLVHPYIILKNGENHHLKRYPKYPKIGVLLQDEADTDAEDIRIVTDIYQRLALNLHSEVKFVKRLAHTTIEEMVHETGTL